MNTISDILYRGINVINGDITVYLIMFKYNRFYQIFKLEQYT